MQVNEKQGCYWLHSECPIRRRGRWTDLLPGWSHKTTLCSWPTSDLLALEVRLTSPTPLPNSQPPSLFHHSHPLHCTLTSEVLTSIFCLIKAAWGEWPGNGAKKRSNEHDAAAHTDWPQGEKHNKMQDRLPVVRSPHTTGATAELSCSIHRGRIKGLFSQILFWCSDFGRLCDLHCCPSNIIVTLFFYNLRLDHWGFPFKMLPLQYLLSVSKNVREKEHKKLNHIHILTACFMDLLCTSFIPRTLEDMPIDWSQELAETQLWRGIIDISRNKDSSPDFLND